MRYVFLTYDVENNWDEGLSIGLCLTHQQTTLSKVDVSLGFKRHIFLGLPYENNYNWGPLENSFYAFNR